MDSSIGEWGTLARHGWSAPASRRRERPTGRPRFCDAALDGAELATNIHVGGAELIRGVLLPRRPLIHPHGGRAVAFSAATASRSDTPATSEPTQIRRPATSEMDVDDARAMDFDGETSCGGSLSSMSELSEHPPNTTVHRAEGGNRPVRLRPFQGLARPHSARQTRDCTPRCPARCPYCPLGPRLQPLSLRAALFTALSAGVAHSTRRACTLLLDYKLAQRYGLALATPVRRRVTLTARSAARRRARWH